MKFVVCVRFVPLKSQTKSGITIFTAKIQDIFTKAGKLLHNYSLCVVETRQMVAMMTSPRGIIPKSD